MFLFKATREAAKKKLHDQAEKDVIQDVDEFAKALVLQAKLLAYRRGDNEVQSTHVRDALKIVNQSRAESWKKKLSAVFGSILFGTFADGLAGQLSTGSSSIPALHAILGVVGAFLILYGII